MMQNLNEWNESALLMFLPPFLPRARTRLAHLSCATRNTNHEFLMRIATFPSPSVCAIPASLGGLGGEEERSGFWTFIIPTRLCRSRVDCLPTFHLFRDRLSNASGPPSCSPLLVAARHFFDGCSACNFFTDEKNCVLLKKKLHVCLKYRKGHKHIVRILGLNEA